MKKLFIALFAVLLISHFSFLTSHFSKAYADTSCQPIYGGGQTCVTTNNVNINKTILNPQTNKMVDNLSVNDPKYQPDFISTFQITVTNTGSSEISKIKVDDIFPQYITFSSGPGIFDANTKILTFEVDNLKSNESRTFTIMGRIVDSAQIPLAQGIVCVVNQAIATNLDNSSQTAQDNSQLCIEKKIAVTQTLTTNTKGGFPVLSSVPVTTTPATGPEMLGLIALIPTGIAGWILRKKSEFSNRKEKN